MDLVKMYMSSFTNINHQSIKLILKNGKSMASLVIISHSHLSIFTFFFCISANYIDNMMSYSLSNTLEHTSKGCTFHLLLMLAQIAFGFVFVATLSISSNLAVLISAASCTGQQFCVAWRRPWTIRFRVTLNLQAVRYLVSPVHVSLVVVFLSVMYPRTLTFSMSILLGVMADIFLMYLNVAWALSMVVFVVEEGTDASEKGEQLAQGHRVHGFLLNVFFTLVASSPLLGCWWIVGSDVYKALDWKFPFLELLVVNTLASVNLLAVVEYTVLYFQFKEYHGQNIQLSGDLQSKV